MNPFSHNRLAWNQQVAQGNPWTIPVDEATIAAAKQGHWKLLLTPLKYVPRAWFGAIEGAKVLALASGGGQQGPILAAAGAQVTVFDASPAQLARDREVALREGLDISIIEGDMADLSVFEDETFDLVFNPCSTMFVPYVRPIWQEVSRVLKPQGTLLAGVANPLLYLFPDPEDDPETPLTARYTIPYADSTAFNSEKIREFAEQGRPLEYGHTLADLIGGQLEAGLVLKGFFEDTLPDSFGPLARLIPLFIATRAEKQI